MYLNKTGYPTSDLISRVFTECDLDYDFNPKNLNSENDEEKLDIFFNIGNFNNILFMIKNGFLKKETIIAELKFPNNFLRSINNPTEKSKKAADFYPDWFKMCCHLKFLFKNEESIGLKYFKLFSSLSEKYNEKECKKFWKNCQPKYGSIPGVFSIIDKFIPPNPQLDRKQLIKNHFFPKKKNKMPKVKLNLMKYNHISSMLSPCEFCDFYSNSKTAMKLHRKVKHGIIEKYNYGIFPIDIICDGCKKIKPCSCKK